MSILGAILAELKTPDAQREDWYGWAANQCSHALFGVIIAAYAPFPLLAALLVGGVKEALDIVEAPTLATLKDSAQDLLFWGMGAAFIITSGPSRNIALIVMIFALVVGVIPRARRAVLTLRALQKQGM